MHMSFLEKLAAHFLPGLRVQSAWLWSSLDGARFNTSRPMRQPHLGDAGEQRCATDAQAAARTMAQRLLEGAQQLQRALEAKLAWQHVPELRRLGHDRTYQVAGELRGQVFHLLIFA